ncbi:peptidoglycan D,D-transpeptidase FtsI family protein [Lacibacterium aquatile]|uniref:Peptidoglycan D,D-transpeptidase FtsI family protein n=1 Tax=Lacibacterium aquatile TaxID=1168082 RepID=A0ABW5DSH4_9PROT
MSVITRMLGFGKRANAAAGKAPIEIAHTRLIVGAALFVVAFGSVGARLVDVTLFPENGGRQALRGIRPTVDLGRADIADRNGILLSTSVATASVFANPKELVDPVDAARRIGQILPDLNVAYVTERLTNRDRSYVYIKRNITPRQQDEINRLGIPGIGFEREDKRLYPQGRLFAHVLGFSDVDNNGLAGVEKGLNERLRAGGDTVNLSVDLRVQHAVREELQAAIDKFKAIGGAAMVMDVNTGEILSLVSLPDFDPSEPGKAPDDARFSRATLGVYEMGSTFKIFNHAMALEYGTTTMTGSYDVSSPIRIARFQIKDDHPKAGILSVPEVFKYSSNIGSVKMAQEVGVNGQREFLGRLGLLTQPKMEIPEIGSPQIPQPWRPINLMTVAFGHGISVSPLQLVTAVSAVVNGGVLLKPTLLKVPEGEPVVGTRVISQKTSANMRRLMRLVVESGTGRSAEATGYMVGGKTGTAEKIGPRGGYIKNANVTSFAGAFPMQSPRYVVLATLDEPQGLKETYNFKTAGWNAAPTAGKIIARIGPMLGVMPVDPTSPEILRQVAINPNAIPPAVQGGPRVATR